MSYQYKSSLVPICFNYEWLMTRLQWRCV